MKCASDAKRCIAFFDGQNLFAAARDAFGFSTASYDVSRLAHWACHTHGWDLRQVRFYTGVPERRDNPGLHRHWTSRLRRMRAHGVVVTSRPLRRRRRRARLDSGETVAFTVLEEKGIDVRIALDAIGLVLAGSCDVVLLFSQDQDFVELADEIRLIAKRERRWIKIASAYPVGSGSIIVAGSNVRTGSRSTEPPMSPALTFTSGRSGKSSGRSAHGGERRRPDQPTLK